MSAIGEMEGRQGRWKRGSSERLRERTSQDPCQYCPARNKHKIVHGILTRLTNASHTHTDANRHTHAYTRTPHEMLTITHYDFVSLAFLPIKKIHDIREAKGIIQCCVCAG